MAILNSVNATPAERTAYLKRARADLRAQTGEDDGEVAAVEEADDEAGEDIELPNERYIELGAAEEHILTLSSEGLGKRSSAYDYRRTGRGGQGLTAHGLGGRAGTRLAASFPVEEGDDLLLVTSGGQMIRTPVGQVRIVGRASQGVTIFRTAEGERVVSVERLPDSGDEDGTGADVDGEAEGGEGGGES